MLRMVVSVTQCTIHSFAARSGATPPPSSEEVLQF
eukprot:COSAG02_NODE_16472_length_1080_cov_1.320082_2_plen_34_part_01